MSAPGVPPAIDTLLAHRDWVRGVARALVVDAARAADLEQETWLAALRGAPASVTSPRAWLGSVLRRQAARSFRNAARAERRERAVARSEALPSAADTVAAAEAHERVVRVVLDLAEPYRSTLLLRFFEGLEPAEIAARLGVPAPTVRGRQSRALAMVRERLTAEAGGDGGAWLPALLPLFGADPGSGMAWPGVTAMTTMQKTLAAVAAACVLATALWATTRSDAASTQVGGSPAKETARATAAPEHAAPRNRTARAQDESAAEVPSERGVADATAPAAAPVADDTPPRTTVALHLVDATGAPLTRAAIDALYAAHGRVPTASAHVPVAQDAGDAAARLAEMLRAPGAGWDAADVVDVPQEDGLAGLAVRTPPGADVALVDPWGVPRRAHVAADAATLTLATAADEVRVRCVDATTGDVLRDVHVSAECEGLPGPELAVDAAGCFTALRPAEGVSAVAWWVRSPTHAGRFAWGVLADAAPGSIVDVPVFPAAGVEGRAYLGDGTPARGASVALARAGRTFVATCADDGAFRLASVPVFRAKPEIAQLALVRDAASLDVQVVAVLLRPGIETHRDIGEAAPSGEGARIAGVVRLGGAPLAGAAVVLQGGGAHGQVTRTDAEGRFARERLRPAGYVLTLVLPDTARSEQPILQSVVSIDVAEGESRALEFDLPDGALRVRVLDDAERPVAGAEVRVLAEESDTTRFPGFEYTPGGGAATDADGVALIGGLAPGSVHFVTLATTDPDAADAPEVRAVPGTRDAPAEIVLHVPSR